MSHDHRQYAFYVTGALLGALVASLFSPVSYAQVRVGHDGADVVLEGPRGAEQRLRRLNTRSGDTWYVVDETSGSLYQATSKAGYTTSGSIATLSGSSSYESGDSGGLLGSGGYEAALLVLVTEYGAEIEHDPLLEVDLVGFPNAADPYQVFFDALENGRLYGRPLGDYFGMIEIIVEGEVKSTLREAKPRGRQQSFPDDPFYTSQWNLQATKLDKALWHPFMPAIDGPVRIGIVDSGISERNQGHPGLDGVRKIHQRDVAATSGISVDHGLNLATLLADAATDGDGPAGLVGTWGEVTCGDRTPVFDRVPVELYMYRVGDFMPISYYVARAIEAAVADGVDVINLSLRTAPSAMITRAVEHALEAGVVVVAAAGNYHPGTRFKPTAFPASLEGVISVTAGDKSGRVSNEAADVGYDLVAPGEEVVVGGSGDGWYYGEGTSFAAPHVVATVALMRAANPEVTPTQIRQALRLSSSPSLQGGLLDAFAALNAVLPSDQRVDEQEVYSPSHCGDGAGTTEPDGEAVLAGSQGKEPTLDGIYPNPFNPVTTVRFSLNQGQHVRVAVYNMVGQRVQLLVDGRLEAGVHDVRFDAHALPSGVYMARMESGGIVQNRKMVLMK